ncbi:MAG: DUF2726 domain-containing protein [Rubrivivax sp.]
MGLFDPITAVALCAGGLLLALLMWRRRQASVQQGARKNKSEPLDTVQAWPPEAARVLTIAERRAYDLLRSALPGFLVLAQVPLGRFLRVPTRHSHAEWMRRVGSLSADLLVCNSGSKVLAVIDIRPAEQTESSRRRHERMAAVLKAAGISVLVWGEGLLPSASEVRSLLGAELDRASASGAAAQAKTGPSRPMPLIPVAEMEELLAHGDQAALDMSMEPVPSAFFDDLDLLPQGGAGNS